MSPHTRGLAVRQTRPMYPRCYSMERQRLLALALRRSAVSFRNKRVPHFAPEPAARKMVLADKLADDEGSSFSASRDADLSLKIENIDLPDGSFDTVLCGHVIEPVDDWPALSEIHRILANGGQVIVMMPIVEGWATTYEDCSKVSKEDRRVHFGQFDHIRYYDADFRDRVRDAEYRLSEFWADGADSITYSLLRSERVFIADCLPAGSGPMLATAPRSLNWSELVRGVG